MEFWTISEWEHGAVTPAISFIQFNWSTFKGSKTQGRERLQSQQTWTIDDKQWMISKTSENTIWQSEGISSVKGLWSGKHLTQPHFVSVCVCMCACLCVLLVCGSLHWNSDFSPSTGCRDPTQCSGGNWTNINATIIIINFPHTPSSANYSLEQFNFERTHTQTHTLCHLFSSFFSDKQCSIVLFPTDGFICSLWRR